MKKTRGYKKWLIDTRHYLKNKKRESILKINVRIYLTNKNKLTKNVENNAEKNISTQHKQKRKESMKAYKKINPTMCSKKLKTTMSSNVL